MSCTDNTCGTGGWTGPVPGDPDNNVTLSARTVFGGINVSWSYPVLNAHAVAHTKVYRGLNNDFEAAVEHAIVGGSFYLDRLNPENSTTYYYWIRIVSINGTLGERIGPVSAIAEPLADQTLETLTGRIDNGVLAQSLKTDIAGITLLNNQLYQEIEDRFSADGALSAALTAVQTGVQDAMTYINEEITQRTDADSALLSQLNTMAAAVDQNVAAIFEEKTLRVTADEALATDIEQLYVKTGDNKAAIETEATVRATKDEAIASSVTQLATTVGQVSTAVYEESIARSNADSGLSSRITTTEVAINGNVATGQVGLTTKINTVDGKVTSIGALYTAKVQVNGLIGGFGVYNDGSSVEAGFDVDTFWIGRTSANKVKPFIVSGGIVYMDAARIRDADIGTLKLAGNSVTVPGFITAYGTTSGNGGWSVVASISIVLDQPGMVFATTTGVITYGTGWTPASSYLIINGVNVSEGGGEEGWVNAVHSGGVFCNAGTITAQLMFKANDSKARIVNPTIFIQGAKR